MGRLSKFRALFLIVWGLLIATAGVAGTDADEKDTPPAAGKEVSREEWARRLAALNDVHFKTVEATALELARLPPDEGFDILQKNWSKIARPRTREMILSAWFVLRNDSQVPSRHPRLIDLVDLGMRDESIAVQRRAEDYVRRLALQDFIEDFQEYKAWYESARGKPVVDVVSDSVRRIVAAMEKAEPAAARKHAQRLKDAWGPFHEMGETRQVALDAGLMKLIERWISAGLAPMADKVQIELAADGLKLLSLLRLGEEDVQRIAVPLLAESVPSSIRVGAMRVVNRKEFPWAVDRLLEVATRPRRPSDRSVDTEVWELAGSLASQEDPRVIPTMIALIEADNTQTTIYGIGYWGLSKLTRVEFDEKHDGAWWRAWWEKNRERYPEPVRSMEIPKLAAKVDEARPARAVEPIPTPVRADSATSVDDPRVVWLNKNAVAVRSINPANDDFADLMPLRKLIGDARIVQLGEESHGDGAAFYAKARLIRFLHEKMGFDVLAWESGMLDCRIAESNLRSSAPALDWTAKGIFPIWSVSKAVEPVFEHLKASQLTPTPMAFCGFDCQFSTLEPEAASQLVLDFFDRVDEQLLDKAHRTALTRLIEGPQPGQKSESRPNLEPIEKLLKLLEEREADFAEFYAAREIKFMRRVLRNISVLVAMRSDRGNGPESTNVRDAAMAENLLWLADEYYPGRKIIVWAASFHLLRNAPGVVPVDRPPIYEKTVSMGHTVAEKLGRQVYSIAFSAYSGSAGNPVFGTRQLPTSSKGTLEELLHAAGFAHAIVDLRSMPAREGGAWLKEPQIARPLGYSPMQARWPNHFDAVFYSDVMFPSTDDAELPEELRP